jgi:mono/diheme cytochrome c family protein
MMFEITKQAMGAYGLATAAILLCTASANAQDATTPSAEPSLSPTRVFAQKSGEALYNNVCQACHMQGGTGAVGAGHYPELAKNPKLGAAGYPIMVVLRGLNGMPPVGKMMTDEQGAEVINYLRTHFGNSYEGKVTAQDVAQAR